MSQKLITGRLSVHRDGFGFVTPETAVAGLDRDIFLPPDSAAKAMHGDRVAVRIVRLNPRDGRAEGDIVKVLERVHESVTGRFRLRRNKYYVEPWDVRLHGWIEIPAALVLPKKGKPVDRVGAAAIEVQTPEDLEGMIVTAELLEFPSRDAEGVGRITEILGHPDDFGVDVEIMIRKHRIPHRFPPQVLEEARAVREEIPESEAARREDFRGLDIVTIDGETARDFDDAVWVDRLPNGNFLLQVHIADVAYFVRPGSAIDREAIVRGTSVYFPDRAVPMLPLELSTGACSLKPKVDRLVMSALMEIDHRGDVVAQRFTRGVIRSAERMTYTAVHAILQGDPALRDRYAALVPRFELMKELAGILNRKRTRRGSIDFDLPEPLIEFDEFGEMTGISRAPRNIAHRLIEEFMLAANEAVAGHVAAAGYPIPYRVHEPPDAKKVAEFEDIAAQFGASLGVKPVAARFRETVRRRDGRKSGRDIIVTDANLPITSRHYQKLLARIEGKPEERILSYLMLRSLKQARYAAENLGHFALASGCYCHFTSPIRRYPDLVVHRVLGALLDGQSAPYTLPGVEAISEQASKSERAAAEAERELVEWKKVKFMTGRVGDEFTGLIISTQPFGFFVELDDLFVEGLVPIASLAGDQYGFVENTRRIVGRRTRREFKVGDRVTVRLDRVNGLERKLEFSLAGSSFATPGKSRRPRSS